jgi:hypothetical protein
MASEYQLIANYDGVLRYADGATIPPDGGNRDWQTYTEWLAEGNEPDPAPPPSRQGVIMQSAQALSFSQAKSLNTQGRTQEAVAAILDMLEPKT